MAQESSNNNYYSEELITLGDIDFEQSIPNRDFITSDTKAYQVD